MPTLDDNRNPNHKPKVHWWDWMNKFKSGNPGFWASLSTTQQARYQKMVQNAFNEGKAPRGAYRAFVNTVKASDAYVSWQLAGGGDGDGSGDGDGTGDPPPDTSGQDARDLITQFLESYGITNMADFVGQAVTEGWSTELMMLKLRETQQYKAAFPEMAERAANGLSWMPESQVLAQRDEVKRLAHDYLGVNDVTKEEMAHLIGGGTSLAEWERRLQTYNTMLQWGPSVKMALEQELGYSIDDDRVFAFMNPDIPTPELDKAYENALYRGQPAVLGFGIRPEEEANMLRQYGINPQEAFKGYQGVAAELPREERLKMIENYINTNSAQFPDAAMKDASFGTLFRAIQLRDPSAINQLQTLMSHENARWQAGGGPARSGTATAGLLTQAEREAY